MSKYNTINTLEKQIRGRENRVYNIIVFVERLVIILQFVKKL